MALLKDLVKEIKKKKTISSLDDSFVKDLVELELDNKIKEKLENHPKPVKAKEFKLIVKNVRRKLHDVYGIFNISKRSLKELEEHLKKVNKIDKIAIEIHTKLLLTHKSTKERVDDNSFVYKKIFEITGKPKTILDLACGLNPLSFPFMGLKNVEYYAVELSDEYCSFLKDYFYILSKFGLEGEAIKADLLKTKKFTKVDVCFLFKTLDSLETLKKDVSEELLKRIDARFIVVSFPTKTIGGRKDIKERGWFMKLLRKLDYSYDSFEIENEVFYILKN